MKLKSFGCSFVYGTDLPMPPTILNRILPSDRSFPALIAARKNLEYCCYARPGAGNFEILCTLIDQIAKGDPCLYMVNWSWSDRFSYVDDSTRYRHWRYNQIGWNSIMPNGDDNASHVYYKYLHNQFRDKLETLICIKSGLDHLLTSGQSFIMTWTDASIWETQWHNHDPVPWLQSQVLPYLSSFENQSFYEWSRQKNFAISSTWHPLEEAHQAAADLILDRWDEFVKN